MKTAKEWVDENSQSGAFDSVGSIKDAEEMVKEIQRDAIASYYGKEGEKHPVSSSHSGLILLIIDKERRLNETRQKQNH